MFCFGSFVVIAEKSDVINGKSRPEAVADGNLSAEYSDSVVKYLFPASGKGI